MVSEKHGEEAIVSNFDENESQSNMQIDGNSKEDDHAMFSMKSFFWHGGSVWDAWFSCASNQVSPLCFIKKIVKIKLFTRQSIKKLIQLKVKADCGYTLT